MYLHMVLGIIVIFLWSSSAAPIRENNTKTDIDDLLEAAFLRTDLQDKESFILILGDNVGVRSELSKVLRQDTTTAGTYQTRVAGGFDALFPSVDLDHESGSWIIDWPGFNDDSILILDLIAGFLNKIIFDSAKRMKIVILTSPMEFKFQTMTRRPVIDLLEKLLGVIGENYASFNNSVAFIETKISCSNSDDEAIWSFRGFLGLTSVMIQSTPRFLSNVYVQNEPFLRRMASTLLSNVIDQKAYYIFKRPAQKGSTWSASELEENREELRKLIFGKTQFSIPSAYKFQEIVRNVSRNYIKTQLLYMINQTKITLIADGIFQSVLDEEMLDNLFENVTITGCDEFDRFKSELNMYCNNYVQKLLDMTPDMFNDYVAQVNEKMWRKLKFEMEKREFLFALAEKDPTELKSQIYTTLKSRIWQKFHEMLKKQEEAEY